MNTSVPSKGRPVYLVDGARTPFLKIRGVPGPFSAAELAISATREILLRHSNVTPHIDEVIAGCVMPSPDETNIGRVIALRAGCGEHVPGWTVQRNCASGLQAIDSAMKNIAAGDSELVIAGGTEAMSHAPLLFQTDFVRWLGEWAKLKGAVAAVKHILKLRPRFFSPVVGLLRGLSDPVVGLSMGKTAEEVAYRFGITRAEMDAFSVRSHQRLAQAQTAGHFAEIETMWDGAGHIYASDDGVRPDSSVEALAKLQPYFDKPIGTVTPGNSSQITDGAAFLLLASEEAVKKYQLPVMARVVACSWAALDPKVMGLGPAYAIAKLLKATNLRLEDIAYWEINEAFAAQVIGCLKALEDKTFCEKELGLNHALGAIDPNRLNVDGGAIALGHPVGATGARLALHLAHILKRERARYGVASLCIGGGQGGALLLERVE